MECDGGNESASDANQCREEEYPSDLEENKSEWDLKVCTVVGPSGTSDSIGALAFDAKEYKWLATGGLARKIRLYNFNNLVDLQQSCSHEDKEEDLMDIDGNSVEQRNRFCGNDVLYVEHSSSIETAVICTSAKLSSLKWDPASGDLVICSGDYDGVVTEWDVERGIAVSERDEHGGRRVWSVDYSQWNTSLCASASDDGTVQMWDRKTNQTLMDIAIPSKRPVCCAEFSAYNANLMAFACSDHKVYVYDTRKLTSSSSAAADSALFVLNDHSRPVSSVKFFGEGTVVSASTDGSLKLWDISRSIQEGMLPVRTYRGHSNMRKFVGLSVWQEGGLLACGSESNEVYAYDCRWESPIWLNKFDGTGFTNSTVRSLAEDGVKDFRTRADLRFVSGVCWRQKPSNCALVAANSDGMLQVIIGQRTSSEG
ncbi:hypothetical protein SUGI_0885300 [Cryptomeria japonica]|uniref:WD repeat-containing protein RUP2 n=1 Tax=Cryptomeria japonica TaxID=3369 RepID=UPI0024149127|nr:WD repeat-containing protein RUP2 [Cryptomeria japonica]GLJ42702.1 hypothetical protein SUGI_0885300 [Cryptomeria japonica]